MASDDTITTCHAAIPFDNGTVLSLRVATDGEGFASTVSLIKNFPDGTITDVFDESLLISDISALSEDYALLADSTGRIIELRDGAPIDLIALNQGLSGIRMSSASRAFAYGLEGAVFVSPDWTALPNLRSDVLAICLTSHQQLFACGESGLLAHYFDGAWQEIEVGTNVALNGICELPNGHLLVVGMKGFAGIFADGEWSLLELPELDFYDTCLFQNEPYIGAGPDGLHVLRNGELILIKDNVFSYTLRACKTYLGIAGDNEIVVYDGKDFPYISFEDELGDD